MKTKEPLPARACYYDDIEAVTKRLTAIAKKAHELFAGSDSKSRNAMAHEGRAEQLQILPDTDKLRIAILGGAGTGKSSLLNLRTDTPALAESVVQSRSMPDDSANVSQLSGRQSCTCVPTQHSGPFGPQKGDFAASIRYYTIDQIRTQLLEMIKDYSDCAFERAEQEKDWDEDVRTAAKRAHENAFKMPRTLFNDLPAFGSKTAGQAWFLKFWKVKKTTTAIETLMENCEKKLKPFISKDGYTEYREANTLTQLRSKLYALVCSTLIGLIEPVRA